MISIDFLFNIDFSDDINHYSVFFGAVVLSILVSADIVTVVEEVYPINCISTL
jgi:hypothetical protein